MKKAAVIVVLTALLLCLSGCASSSLSPEKIKSRIDYYRGKIVDFRERGEAVAVELKRCAVDIQILAEEIIDWAGTATEPPTLDQVSEYSARFWSLVAAGQDATRRAEAIYEEAKALYKEAENDLSLGSSGSTIDDIRTILTFVAGLLK